MLDHMIQLDLRQHHCVYFIGIGGISMSALAQILRNKGMQVRGYDRNESETVEQLRGCGIPVWTTDDASAFDGVDLVCYTAAVNSEHPQMKLAAASGARIVSRAQLLGSIAASYPNAVAVAGTHGKSTTSGMLAHILLHADSGDPTVVVGAVVPELGSTYRLGNDENFVFEACEYKDSFLSFYPHIAVVLNIKMDHTDYFHSMEQMVGSFRQFLQNTGKDGIGIINADCENCLAALQGFGGQAVTFSAEGNANASYTARNVDLSNGFGSFDVYERGAFLLHAKLGVPGLHNVSNALAAIAAARLCGARTQEIAEGLLTYHGVGRRFEALGELNGAQVFDDYAHHPDEIRATLSAARALAHRRVICVFQPHNYSRLHDLFEDFCASFADADRLILTKLYAAREAAGSEVSAALLAERLGADYLDSKEDILPYLETIAQPDDIILLMGAGDIAGVAEKFKKSKKKT